jgi:hypothetical protein
MVRSLLPWHGPAPYRHDDEADDCENCHQRMHQTVPHIHRRPPQDKDRLWNGDGLRINGLLMTLLGEGILQCSSNMKLPMYLIG